MKFSKWPVLLLLVMLARVSANTPDGYQIPSKALADVVDAKLAPSSRLSPNNQWMALFERQRIASLKDLSKAELKLAGITLNAKNFGRSRPRSKYLSIEIKHLTSGKTVSVKGLADGRILSPSWSPDSEHIAFIIEQTAQSFLYLFNVATQQLTRSDIALNAVITSKPYR